jgi:hypothetical protein
MGATGLFGRIVMIVEMSNDPPVSPTAASQELRFPKATDDPEPFEDAEHHLYRGQIEGAKIRILAAGKSRTSGSSQSRIIQKVSIAFTEIRLILEKHL